MDVFTLSVDCSALGSWSLRSWLIMMQRAMSSSRPTSQTERQRPSYAQPTLASGHHSTPKKDQGRSTLRAGTGRQSQSARGSRPSSVKSTTPVKKSRADGPAFLRIFKSPGQEEDGGDGSFHDNNISGPASLRSLKSASYRSPKLVSKSTTVVELTLPVAPQDQNTTTRPRAAMIAEIEGLMNELSNQPDNLQGYSINELYSAGLSKPTISHEDWNRLVDYHGTILSRALNKVELDHKLIQNILELNNAISTAMNELQDCCDNLTLENDELRTNAQLLEQTVEVLKRLTRQDENDINGHFKLRDSNFKEAGELANGDINNVPYDEAALTVLPSSLSDQIQIE